MTTGRINQVAIVTPRRGKKRRRRQSCREGPHAARADAPGDGGAKTCTRRSSITMTEMLRRGPGHDGAGNTPNAPGTRRTTQASLTLPPAQTPTMRRPSGRKTPDTTGTDRAQPPAGAAVAPAMTHRRATAQGRRSECDTDWQLGAVANVCTSCSNTSASSGGSRQAPKQAWGAQCARPMSGKRHKPGGR